MTFWPRSISTGFLQATHSCDSRVFIGHVSDMTWELIWRRDGRGVLFYWVSLTGKGLDILKFSKLQSASVKCNIFFPDCINGMEKKQMENLSFKNWNEWDLPAWANWSMITSRNMTRDNLLSASGWPSRKNPSAPYAYFITVLILAFTFLRQFTELVRKRYLSRDVKADMHSILAEYFSGQWSKGQLRPILLPSLTTLLNADRKVLFKVTKSALSNFF